MGRHSSGSAPCSWKEFIFVSLLAFNCITSVAEAFVANAGSRCELVGKGKCNEPDRSASGWPLVADKDTPEIQDCCKECFKNIQCTGFQFKNTQCTLFGHSKIGASGIETQEEECFRVIRDRNDEIERDVQEAINKKKKVLSKQIIEENGELAKEVEQENSAGIRTKRSAPTKEKSGKKSDRTNQVKKKEVSPSKATAAAAAGDPTPPKDPKEKPSKINKKKKKKSFIQRNETHEIKKFPMPKVAIDKKYGDKYLHLVGPGGCRGSHWSRGSWPKFMGRQTLKHCVELCADDEDCRAIHILRPDQTKVECLLFRNRRIITVPRLGGNCYKLSDHPQLMHEDDEVVEVDKKIEIPVELVHLGKGMCRGPKWATKTWPILMGYRSLKSCADECARRKKCLAFDISKPKNGKFDCLLYGHTLVKPASGVKGECYTLTDRLEDALGVEDDEDEEETADDEEELLDAHTTYRPLGVGMCRGEFWQDGKWPRDMGLKSVKGCASACEIKKQCKAFDLSGKIIGGKQKCLLYHHKHPHPASGVPGHCYLLHRHERLLQKDQQENAAETKDNLKKPESPTAANKKKPESPTAANKKKPESPAAETTGDNKKKPETSKEQKNKASNKKDEIKGKKESNKEKKRSKRSAIYLEEEEENDSLLNEIATYTLKKLEELVQNIVRPIADNYQFSDLGEVEPDLLRQPMILLLERDGTLTNQLRKDLQEVLEFVTNEDMNSNSKSFMEKASLVTVPFQVGKTETDDNFVSNLLIDQVDMIILVVANDDLQIDLYTRSLLQKLQHCSEKLHIVTLSQMTTQRQKMAVQKNTIWNVSQMLPNSIQPEFHFGTISDGFPILQREVEHAVENRVPNRIESAHKYSTMVYQHAKMVDSYLKVLHKKSGYFGDNTQLQKDIVENPEKHDLINKSGLSKTNQDYTQFFQKNPLSRFPTLVSSCTMFSGCPIKKLEEFLDHGLKDLAENYNQRLIEFKEDIKINKRVN